jgi:hypothetical protein
MDVNSALSLFGPVGVGPARLFAQNVTKTSPNQVAIDRMRNLASLASSKSPDKKELNPPFKLDFSRIRSGKTETKEPQYIHKLVAQSIHKWFWKEKKSLTEVGGYNKEDKKFEKILFAERKYEDFKYLTIEQKKKMKEFLGIFERKKEKYLVFKASNRIFESKFDIDRLNESLFDKWLQNYSSSTLGISAGDNKDVKCEMKKIFRSALQLVNTEHNKKFVENEKKMFEIVSSKKLIREEYITKCKEIIDKFKEMDSNFQAKLKSNGIDIKKIQKYKKYLEDGKKGSHFKRFFKKKRLSDNDLEKYKKFIDENYDKIEEIKKEQESLQADVGIDPSNGDSKGDCDLQKIIKSKDPKEVRSDDKYIDAKIELEKESALKNLKAKFYSETNIPKEISSKDKKLMQEILTKYSDLAQRLSDEMSKDCKSRVDQCGNKYRNLDQKFMNLKSLADCKLSYLPNSWDAINFLIEKAENLRTEIARKQSTFSPDTKGSTKTAVDDQIPVATVVPEGGPGNKLKASSVHSTEDTSSEISLKISSEVDNICDAWQKMKGYIYLCEKLDCCLKRLASKLNDSSVENTFRLTAKQIGTSVKEQARNLQSESMGAVNKLNTGVESTVSGVGGGVLAVVGGFTSSVNYVAEGLNGLGKIGSVQTPSFSVENMFKLSETSRQRKKNEQEALLYLGQLHLHSGVPLPEGWGHRSDGSAYQKNFFESLFL